MNKIFAFIILLLVITVSVVIITSENANAIISNIENANSHSGYIVYSNPIKTIIKNIIVNINIEFEIFIPIIDRIIAIADNQT